MSSKLEKDEPTEVPTIHFHYPQLTGEQIVKAVQTGKSPWRSLQALHEDAVEAERQRILAKYDTTLREIPKPEWDVPDELKR
jgi:hypothetical protein